ncbi:MAG: O-antigen ligase family protein [bacterium]
MSLRSTLAILLLVIGSFWTLRRPFVGVCMVIALFHLNLRTLGAGLDEIRFQFVITLVLAASYMMNREELLKDILPLRTPMKMMFAFLGMTFLTSIWAVSSIELAFDNAVDFAKIVWFSWLMMRIVRTEREMRILMYVTFAGMWYTSFMAAWGVEWGWINEMEVGVATGGAGAHLMMFMPLLVLLTLYGNWKERLYCATIIPFVLNFLPNTPDGSRSTLVILVTSMSLMLFLAPGSMRFRIAVPILAGALLFVFFLTPPHYWDDMKTIVDPHSESSARSRFVINDATFRIISEYPAGIGYNNYSLISMRYLPEEMLTELGSRDAHNSYLKVAAEFGLVGFVIWILLFFTSWRDFRRVRKTMQSGVPPTQLQLTALALELGLIGITLGIYTHNYNDLDTLYWFVAFSSILMNLHDQQTQVQPGTPERALPRPGEVVSNPGLQQQIPHTTKKTAPVAAA